MDEGQPFFLLPPRIALTRCLLDQPSLLDQPIKVAWNKPVGAAAAAGAGAGRFSVCDEHVMVSATYHFDSGGGSDNGQPCVFVGNLSQTIEQEDLFQAFAPYGCSNARICYDAKVH